MDEILNGDEQILWQGKTALLPFLAGAILSLLLGIGPLAILAHFVAGQPSRQRTDLRRRLSVPVALPPGRLPVGRGISDLAGSGTICASLTPSRTQRVVFQSGVIVHDVAMVDFDQIVHADTEVGLTDIFLGLGRTGSISLTTAPVRRGGGRCGQNAACPRPYPPSLRRVPLLPPSGIEDQSGPRYPNRFDPDTNPGSPRRIAERLAALLRLSIRHAPAARCAGHARLRSI